MTKRVSVTTLQLDNTAQGGSNNKFYRLFQVAGDTTFYAQWGSQRNGRYGGQYGFWSFPSEQAANAELVNKLTTKMSEGYSRVPAESGSVDVDDNIFHTDPKSTAGSLRDQLWGSMLAKSVPLPPIPQLKPKTPKSDPFTTPSGSTAGVIEALNDRCVDVIAHAAENPYEAFVTLSLLREEYGKVAQHMRKLDAYLDTIEMLTEGAM